MINGQQKILSKSLFMVQKSRDLGFLQHFDSYMSKYLKKSKVFNAHNTFYTLYIQYSSIIISIHFFLSKIRQGQKLRPRTANYVLQIPQTEPENAL